MPRPVGLFLHQQKKDVTNSIPIEHQQWSWWRPQSWPQRWYHHQQGMDDNAHDVVPCDRVNNRGTKNAPLCDRCVGQSAVTMILWHSERCPTRNVSPTQPVPSFSTSTSKNSFSKSIASFSTLYWNKAKIVSAKCRTAQDLTVLVITHVLHLIHRMAGMRIKIVSGYV